MGKGKLRYIVLPSPHPFYALSAAVAFSFHPADYARQYRFRERRDAGLVEPFVVPRHCEKGEQENKNETEISFFSFSLQLFCSGALNGDRKFRVRKREKKNRAAVFFPLILHSPRKKRKFSAFLSGRRGNAVSIGINEPTRRALAREIERGGEKGTARVAAVSVWSDVGPLNRFILIGGDGAALVFSRGKRGGKKKGKAALSSQLSLLRPAYHCFLSSYFLSLAPRGGDGIKSAQRIPEFARS